MSKGRKKGKPSNNHGKSSKEIGNGHKVFTITVFAALFIYLVGYMLVFVSRPSISIETVTYGSIDVPATLKGIVIRDEVVLKSEEAGEVHYNFAENERVSKNAVVCSIRDAENYTADLETEIQKIDKSIIEIQKNRAEFSLFKEDIERIDKNIAAIIDSNIFKNVNGNLADLYTFKTQVQNQIDQRNQIWLAEKVKSTSQLNTEKSHYENRINTYSKAVSAPQSGIFSLKTDGFEDIITPDGRNDVSEESIKMKIPVQYISKSMAVDENDPLFRLVVSNTWYIASYVPNEVAAQWEVGDFIDIYTVVDEETISVNVRIESMKTLDKSTYAVFVTDRKLVDFIDLRTIEFKIQENVYEGFKVPNSAIIEKNFIKIPKDVLTTSVEDTGVIKKGVESDTFFNINIANSDEDNVYILQDFETLKIGDILVKPGLEGETYTLSQVATYKGVYVANSSISKFMVIDIVGQNTDYTIVNAQSQYGLKIYDKIVTDAKTVEDSTTVN